MAKMYWVQNVHGNPGVYCLLSDALAEAISDFEKRRYKLHPEISGVQYVAGLSAVPGRKYEQKKLHQILHTGKLDDLIVFCREMNYSQAVQELEADMNS